MNDKPVLLDVRDLSVSFSSPLGPLVAVRGVSFQIREGEIMGIVGESGSGKSISMRAIMGLLPKTATVEGSVRFRGEELLGRSYREMSHLRGSRIAMIFQDPMTALNPVLTIGQQVVEAIRIHDKKISGRRALDRAVELLASVAIPFPEQRLSQYPHEFSGGMRQRVVIAIATANRPDLIIADEPTTALDVTVQAQILELLKKLCVEHQVGLALITHDLGVVAGLAKDVSVMYSGSVVEHGAVDDIFYDSRHPYTRGLLGSLPKLQGKIERLVDIGGLPPAILKRPSGCAFGPRCSFAQEVCLAHDPALRPAGRVESACHFADVLPAVAREEVVA